MPGKTKTKNVKKGAAALTQSILALRTAVDRMKKGHTDAGDFYSVQKSVGNGSFVLRNAKGAEIRGVPRGLFTSGSMRISAGQIVLAMGDPKLGVEIMAVIQDRSEAKSLMREGVMEAAVFNSAQSAGVMAVAEEEDEDLFDRSEEAGGSLGAGAERVARSMGEQRAAAATQRTIEARVQRLLGGGGSSAEVEDDKKELPVVDLEDL